MNAAITLVSPTPADNEYHHTSRVCRFTRLESSPVPREASFHAETTRRRTIIDRTRAFQPTFIEDTTEKIRPFQDFSRASSRRLMKRRINRRLSNPIIRLRRQFNRATVERFSFHPRSSSSPPLPPSLRDLLSLEMTVAKCVAPLTRLCKRY